MPQDKNIPGSTREWMARAKGDLVLAGTPLPKDAYYEDLCFHTQQAAGKAIKAVYLHHGWTFVYTHDIEKLLSGLKQLGLKIPPEVKDADVLTHYAWGARYPGFGEPVTVEEYREALHQAETVVTWAENAMFE